MADEPLYCQQCGAEDWACEHNPENGDGTYCETCGARVDKAACRECDAMAARSHAPGGLPWQVLVLPPDGDAS